MERKKQRRRLYLSLDRMTRNHDTIRLLNVLDSKMIPNMNDPLLPLICLQTKTYTLHLAVFFISYYRKPACYLITKQMFMHKRRQNKSSDNLWKLSVFISSSQFESCVVFGIDTISVE